MFMYRVTFLGGSEIKIRANSPKEAWEQAGFKYQLEVIHIKCLR